MKYFNFTSSIGIDFLAFNQRMVPSRIKSIRKIFKLTQIQFSEFIGVSFHTYKNWEIGHRIPCSPAAALLYIAETQPDTFIKNREEIISMLKTSKVTDKVIL